MSVHVCSDYLKLTSFLYKFTYAIYFDHVLPIYSQMLFTSLLTHFYVLSLCLSLSFLSLSLTRTKNNVTKNTLEKCKVKIRINRQKKNETKRWQQSKMKTSHSELNALKSFPVCSLSSCWSLGQFPRTRRSITHVVCKPWSANFPASSRFIFCFLLVTIVLWE